MVSFSRESGGGRHSTFSVPGYQEKPRRRQTCIDRHWREVNQLVRGAELHNGPNPECRGSGARQEEQPAQPNIPCTLSIGFQRARGLHFISRIYGHNRFMTGPRMAEIPHSV